MTEEEEKHGSSSDSSKPEEPIDEAYLEEKICQNEKMELI
jgi:hypothetical protein